MTAIISLLLLEHFHVEPNRGRVHAVSPLTVKRTLKTPTTLGDKTHGKKRISENRNLSSLMQETRFVIRQDKYAEQFQNTVRCKKKKKLDVLTI